MTQDAASPSLSTSELQFVGVDESICTSRVGNSGSTSQLMLSRQALGVPMVLVCFGVFQCANYWCAHWCELGNVWRYKNPSLVKKIRKDLLDPGEFMFTAGSVQVVQVKVAEVYLVMEANEEDVPIFLLGFMEAWWFLWWALVKFASLEPRSV